MSATFGAMLRACLLLALVAGSWQLNIYEFAVPSAVEANKNAELQCRFANSDQLDYIKWWFTPLYVTEGEGDRVLLYQRLGFHDHVPETPRKNVEIKGNDTIVIMDLKPSDSGVYECEVASYLEERKRQELIVFSNGTGVELNVTKVEDGPDDDNEEEILVQCEAREVTPQPELLLFINGKEVDNVTQYLNEDIRRLGLFDAYVNLTLSPAELDDAEIRCELFFDNRKIAHPPYFTSLTYTSGAVTTAEPELSTVATHSQLASKLKNDNGAFVHRSSGMVYATFAALMYFQI